MMPLKAIWQENTPYSKFLLAVGVILISAVVFTILSTLAATAIFGINMLQLETLITDFKNPVAISVLKLIQTISTIGTFIIPSLLIAWLFSSQPMNYIGLDKKPMVISSLLVIVLLLAALPFINYLGELNSHMALPSFLSGMEKWMKDSEDKAAQLTEKFLEMTSFGDFLFATFMIALLPAIGEELMFRGVVQRIFSDWSRNIHVGIWASAILFSAMHVQFYGFFPRMLLGATFGYLYIWSGSLWLPIIGHFINNASAVLLTYLFKAQMISLDADKLGTENDFIPVVVSALLIAGLLWMIYRSEKKQKELIV